MVLPPLSVSMTGISSLSAMHAWPFMSIQHSEPWLPRCQLRKLEPTAQDKPPGLCHRTHCTCWVNFTSLYLQYCQINTGEVSDGCRINSSLHQGLLQTITSSVAAFATEQTFSQVNEIRRVRSYFFFNFMRHCWTDFSSCKRVPINDGWTFQLFYILSNSSYAQPYWF